MGLEMLELVLETEKEFNIRLQDREVTKCVTPRRFIDLVWSKLVPADPRACPTQHAFYRIRQALVTVLGVSRRSIRPSTPLQSLFPDETGKDAPPGRSSGDNWLALRQTLNPPRWPPVHQSPWSGTAITFVVLLLCGIVCSMLVGLIAPGAGAVIFIGTFTGAIIFGMASNERMGRWNSPIRVGNGTVRDLVPYLQPAVYASRDDVARRFKTICEEQLGLDLSKWPHWEDANFVRDWNCG